MKGLKGVVSHYDWEELNTVVISVPEKALKGLKNNPNIEILEPDLEIGLDAESESANGSDRRRSLLLMFVPLPMNGLPQGQTTPYGVDMMEVRKLGVRGGGQKVCLLDTGYDVDHPDLPKDVDWIWNGTPPEDKIDEYGVGHGTHVAGTIAALDNDNGVVGVAPRARLVIVPFVGQDSFISNTVNAIWECKKKGATIVNMSFGYGKEDCMQFGSFFKKFENDAMTSFVERDNMLLVAAAGNHGHCAIYSDEPLYPASYDAVISVASVDSHARRWESSAKNNLVNIAAPGVEVWSTNPGSTGYSYKKLSGTSMASPHVAAMAAVVWSAMPWLTAPELRFRLARLAHPTYQYFTGAGLVTHGFTPIVLQRSGKCLDYIISSQVRLDYCYDHSNSLWSYDWSRKLIVSSTGLCLNANPYEGGAVYMSNCDPNSTNQQWDYDSNKKTFTFRGYCLNADWNENFKNGGRVYLWSCNGEMNQKWLFQQYWWEKVLLCRHPDCNGGGDTYRADVGDWRHMPHQIGDNELTRVVIPKGYAFKYFEHPEFQGRSSIFGSLTNIVGVTLTSDNDTVSSFKIRKLPETGLVQLCRDIDQCTLYLSVGQWSSMPSAIGNDQLSYVHIPQGYTFVYFEHDNFGGWSGTFGSCDYSIRLDMGVHNDAVSSFKIGLAC